MKRFGGFMLFLYFFTVSLCVFAALPELDQVLSQKAMRPAGKYYEALVPDTLDLAQRAELSVNVLTHNTEPTMAYCVYQGFNYHEVPPKKWALSWLTSGKIIFALPMLRSACGSDQGLDVESEIMRAHLVQIREDGMMYFPIDKGVPKDTSYPLRSAMVALAALNWEQRDGNPAWRQWIDLICKGLVDAAIEVQDRAYYPPECGRDADGIWHWSTRGKPITDYTPPDEPVSDNQGVEGAVKYQQSRCILALARHYQLSRDARSLEMARKIARFCLKPGMWIDTSSEGYPGNEHGCFAGHFHGNTTTLYSLLGLGFAENDEWLKQFVREGYDHARRHGVIRLGWFPSWIMPGRYDRQAAYHAVSESCGVADMVRLAVLLSDTGLGDYWDDVDHIVRNHLAEQQIHDFDKLYAFHGNHPESIPLLKNFMGGFGMGEPTAVKPEMYGCCSINGGIGIYYAWHGITRFDDGVATINLLLNRASPWLDIDSYLPYEGKVVIHNKKAHTILVRMPAWVDSMRVKCSVDEQPVKPVRTGSRLMLQRLKGSERIAFQFPVPETTDEYTIHGTTYQVRFRGSTAVDIQPHKDDPDMYPYYDRARLQKTVAPMHKVRRFVADNILPLQ